jgi:hypothetical protein
MANQNEGGVSLQTDTLSQVPGGPARTIIATVMIGGVPTPVQMQVVTLADGNGNVIDDFAQYENDIQIVSELREIRKLLAMFMGVPVVAPENRQIAQDPGFTS